MISSWRRRRAAQQADKKKAPGGEDSGLELTIPSHFKCPISLELMRDPVRLSTGITYDRYSIETWLESGKLTCPVTGLALTSLEPIPNHTIRRMIQDWCAENKSHGVERIPTPRTPLSSYRASDILSKLEVAAKKCDKEGFKELVSKIKGLAKESERNKRCISSNGAGKVLLAAFETFLKGDLVKNRVILEETLSALVMLSPLDEDTASHLRSEPSLRGVIWILNNGDLTSRRNAVLALHEVLSSDQHEAVKLLEIEGGLEALVKVIKDPISPTTTKASLMAIYRVVSFPPRDEQTVTKLVEMGLVELLLETLVDSGRSTCEAALGVLEAMCNVKQGRERACHNALAVPVLVKKILRVSDLATGLSVSILWRLGKNQGTERGDVIIEALQVGAFQKLLLLLQVGSNERTKEKTGELLKIMNLHREGAECIESMDFKNLKRPF